MAKQTIQQHKEPIIDERVKVFLSQYDEQVLNNALKLRKVLFMNLPGITEQMDYPARMIGYCYGQKYAKLIFVIIPSKNGLKLSFNSGNKLPNRYNLLKGTGKISRYVKIISVEQIEFPAVKELILGLWKRIVVD